MNTFGNKDFKEKKLEATNPVSKHFSKKSLNENIQVIIQIPDKILCVLSFNIYIFANVYFFADITAREFPLKRTYTKKKSHCGSLH
ncbi:hypothetical protein RhiirA4_486595 [Rhizophagus irregularis]|uniref:Uncharacterized protein n=1 Tax=Rhizophagus irregularis TaxID=588596 RepID=A0A2I1HRM1_9GLOM|nr:hypothetical protein RhiirA4_486595 [Rhizophagus irregularis]